MRSQIIKTAAVIYFLLAGYNIMGQYKFGIQGGMGVSDYVGKDFSNISDRKTGIIAGIFYEREINLTLSIGFELSYEQKGTFYKYYPREATEVIVDTRSNYISLPILMKAYFGKKAEFYINSGVTTSHLLDQSTSHSAYEYGYEILSEPFFPFKLNSWDASIIAGFGFNVYNIILDIRYHHGLVNIYEGKNVPSIRNHFLSATLGYTIFKRRVERCFNSGY